MSSLILRAATRFMLPLLLLFSVFLLLRGHNSPGGGFSGALVAACAFVLYAIAFGVPQARRALGFDMRSLIGVGLLVALSSGLVGLLSGRPLMTGLWIKARLLGMGELHIGTPLLFDLGVYLVVLGVSLEIILPLVEE